jgi:hypothetical protein
VSIEMLFGLCLALLVLLAVFEAVAYWHARNIYDDAAAEGARVAAAYDGTCVTGIAAARRDVARHASNWARDITVSCVDGTTVAVTVTGHTPGVIGGSLGFTARATETAPKER